MSILVRLYLEDRYLGFWLKWTGRCRVWLELRRFEDRIWAFDIENLTTAM